MVIDTRAFTTCSLGTLISGNINDDYIQGNGLIRTTGSVELSGIVVPEIGTAVTFSYARGEQVYNIPRKLRVLSSFADPFRRTTQVELGCKLTYLDDLREPLKWKPKDDPENSGVTSEDEQIITVPIFASSVMNRCLRKLGIIASSNPLTNIFSIGEFDYSNGYVSILSDLLVSESYCGYLDENEVLQIIDLRETGGTGPLLQSSDFIDISSINSGELPGEAVIVSYSTLKLKNSENGNIQTDDTKATDIDPTLRSFVSWDRSENHSIELISLEYRAYNSQNPIIRYYNTIDYSEEVATYKEFTVYKDVLVKPENEEDQTIDLPDRIETQADEVKRLIDKRVITSTQGLVKVAPTCVSELLRFNIDPGNGPIEQVETVTFFYDQEGEQIFTISETSSSLITAYAALDVPYVFENDVSSGDDIIEKTFGYSVRITNPNGTSSITNYNVAIRFVDPYTDQAFVSKKTTTENVKVGDVTKVITTEYVPFYSTAVGQQVTKEQKKNIRNAAQAMAYVRRMTVLTKSKTSVSITTEEPAPEKAPRESNVANARNVDTNNGSGTPDPNNGWRTESSTESTLSLGSYSAQRRKEFSVPYSSDDYFTIGVLPGGQKLYSSSPSGAQAKARLFGRIQNKLLLGNRSGINIQALPEVVPDTPFAPFLVEANGLSALYRSNGYNWTMDANGVIASVDALFWGAVGGTGDFWFPVAPGIVELPETPPVVDGQVTVETVIPAWNERVLLSAATSTKVSISGFPYALSNSKNISVISRTLAILSDPYVIDPALIAYSQSSVYGPNTAATIAGMQNGLFEEESETGTDNDATSWIQMAFGTTKRVKTVVIGCDFTSVLPGDWGPTYTENCDVETSFDGTTWTFLFNTGTFTQGIQEYKVDILADYVRIVSSGYLAVTEFYALSVSGATIATPQATISIAAIVPDMVGHEVTSILPPSIDIVITAIAPDKVGSLSTDIISPFVDITITAIAPDAVGYISTNIEIPSIDINITGISPDIATGSSVDIPTENITITPIAPVISTGADVYWDNVSLLMHMDGANNSTTFTDSGPNTLTITPSGNTKISTAQSKFGGASGYLDGTGDWLSVANNAVFQFGTGDFTIEMWIYAAASGDLTLLCNGNATFSGSGSTGAVYLALNVVSSTRVVRFGSNTNNPIITGTTAIASNQWYHIALARNGTTLRLFVDGALDATATNNESLNISNNGMLIGRAGWSAGLMFNGYIDDLRITKGVARWTSAFSIPVTAYPDYGLPDAYWDNVSLLLHMDGSNNSTVFTDSSSNAISITPSGDAKISTAQSRFGGASGYFDGNADWLSVADNSVFQFGTGDFTIEAWIYVSGFTALYPAIVANGNTAFSGSGSTDAVYLTVNSNAGQRRITFGTSTTNFILQGSTNIATGQWYHVALSRSGSTNRLFVNGVLDASATNSQSLNISNNGLRIGRTGWSTDTYWNGYIDDLRITKGIARWTSDFSVPVTAYPNQ